MIPKYFSSFVFFLVFVAVSALILFPADSNAQLGCCTNSGNNQCRPNDGVAECRTGLNATCQATQDQCQNGSLSGGNPANNWLAGSTCLIKGNVRQCGAGGCCYSDILEGCCRLSDGTLVEVSELQCAIADGTFLNEGQCEQPPTGCCVTSTMCDDDQTSEECKGDFQVGGTCDDACAPAPPIPGCCQVEEAMCIETTNADCLNSPFFPRGTCEGEGDTFCESPPVGCCVIEQGVCEVITEPSCDDQEGDYQGDGTDCAGNPMCEEPVVVNNVPTLGQWGLIAVAGLLGIYSLIVMRRKNYNLG